MSSDNSFGLSFRDGMDKPLILDGGLATHLETGYKCDLNHKLWSTKILEENPNVIRDAHADFILNGADLIITCTYQSSIGGFDGDKEKFANSVDAAARVAQEAVAKAKSESEECANRNIYVAGSLGSYGASLCSGEEYSGEYKMETLTAEESLNILKQFHLPRMELLKDKVDLFAAETIPVAQEAVLFSQLFAEYQKPGYVSFSCKSASETGSGESIKEAVKNLVFSKFLVGIGVNCSSVRYITSLISEIKAALDEVQPQYKPRILVYPNSGEIYDGITKTWKEDPECKGRSYAELAHEWLNVGASAIGGCCRVTPEQIKEVREKLVPQ